MFDIRAKAADGRLDLRAVIGMRPKQARQAQKVQRTLQRQGVGRPALGQAGAVGLGIGLACLAALDIGAKAACAERNLVARRVLTKDATIDRLLFFARRDRPGIATFGVIAAADESPARARGFQMQTPRATGRAGPRV